MVDSTKVRKHTAARVVHPSPGRCVMTLLPGARVGQTWRSTQPHQRLPWLHITAIDHRYVEGRLTADQADVGGRQTRVPRDQLEQRYRPVSEGNAQTQAERRVGRMT